MLFKIQLEPSEKLVQILCEQGNAKTLVEIRSLLEEIMEKQEEFNAKLETIKTSLGEIKQGVSDVKNAVEAEAAQIAEWIANNSEVDTSGLDDIVANMKQTAQDANTLDENVAAIFTPVEALPTPEPEPTFEPTPGFIPEPTPTPEPEFVPEPETPTPGFVPAPPDRSPQEFVPEPLPETEEVLQNNPAQP